MDKAPCRIGLICNYCELILTLWSSDVPLQFWLKIWISLFENYLKIHIQKNFLRIQLWCIIMYAYKYRIRHKLATAGFLDMNPHRWLSGTYWHGSATGIKSCLQFSLEVWNQSIWTYMMRVICRWFRVSRIFNATMSRMWGMVGPFIHHKRKFGFLDMLNLLSRLKKHAIQKQHMSSMQKWQTMK